MPEKPVPESSGKPPSDPLVLSPKQIRETKKAAQEERVTTDIRLRTDDADQFQAAVEHLIRKERLTREVLTHLQHGAQLEYRQALNIKTRIVTDESYAPTLRGRHNSRVITGTLIRNARDYWNRGDEQYAKALHQMVEQGVDVGLMFIPYLDEAMKDRIIKRYARTRTDEEIHSLYIITEAGGMHPDPHVQQKLREEEKEKDFHADCQIQLSAPSSRAGSIIELPREGDEIRIQALMDEARNFPYKVACVEDVICELDMDGLKLAPSAMHLALETIHREINPKRSGYDIELLAAFIFGARGIRLPDGTVIHFGQGKFSNIGPIENLKSKYVFDRFRSPHCERFQTAWILRSREYRFELDEEPGRTYTLIFDLDAKVSRLKR